MQIAIIEVWLNNGNWSKMKLGNGEGKEKRRKDRWLNLLVRARMWSNQIAFEILFQTRIIS